MRTSSPRLRAAHLVFPATLLSTGCAVGADPTVGSGSSFSASQGGSGADDGTTGGTYETIGGTGDGDVGDTGSTSRGSDPGTESGPTTGESETTTLVGTGGGACGDGTVDPNEACDDGNRVDTDACTNACEPAACGDGIVQADAEACDDGNAINTDACTNACTVAVCGDGITRVDSEACDDGNESNTDGCTNACEAARCGDGFVRAAAEDCDQGGEQTATCEADCSVPSCGDGVLNQLAGEICEPGDSPENTTCPSCVPQCAAGWSDCNGDMADGCELEGECPRFAFVSSVRFRPGQLGGLSGADGECQALADAEGLPGTYYAWLSDSTGSPATRFTRSSGNYIRVDGTKVADNWSDLTDGNLDAPILQSEAGDTLPTFSNACATDHLNVVTNTSSDGTPRSTTNTCSNFSSTSGNHALTGYAEETGRWTAGCAGGSCNSNTHILCFQQ